MKEEFVKINIDYIQPYYFCDKYGNVYSDYKGYMQLLAFDEDKDGYYRVSLQTKNNKRRSFRVNRIIALTFIPNPDNLPVVNHKDNNKKNNNVDNLEWSTVKENTIHGYKYNNYHYVKPVIAIYNNGKIQEFSSVSDCANYFGVSQTTISHKLSRDKAPSKKGKLSGIIFEYKNY